MDIDLKYGDRVMIPIVIGGYSLVGIHDKNRPVSFGNYFSMIYLEKEYSVINMWYENLVSANQQFNMNNEVKVILYHDSHIMIIDDSRIPDSWYNDKGCFTGSRLPPREIAEEIYTYLDHPEELLLWDDPVKYYANKGKIYDPKTGMITFT